MSEDQAEKIRLQREKAIAAFQLGKVGKLPDIVYSPVVGVSFVPGYPENIYALETASLDAMLAGEGLAAVVRNPKNQHDSNACEVHVPALGAVGFVGHIPAAVAARLAQEIDSGTVWHAEVESVRVHPDNPRYPGLTVKLGRIS